MNMSRKILVIGSAGQIGSELVPALRKKYGGENVIATGRKTPLPETIKKSGPVIYLDALDKNSIAKVIFEYEINTIFHMASILSATGEKMPQTAWNINLNGLINVLEVARNSEIKNIILIFYIKDFLVRIKCDCRTFLIILKFSYLWICCFYAP